jgi:hypothetical protein
MIIWKGWGILVIVITAAVMIMFQAMVGIAFGNPQFYRTHDWPKAVALLLAAVAVYFAGSFFNGKPGRVMVDKATGQEITCRRVHSLFFIPMEYWGFILAAIGIILLFVHVQ